MRGIKVFLTLLVYFSCLTALNSCGGDGGDDEITPNPNPNTCAGMQVVEITQDVNTNTIWPGDTVYVIRAWDFYVTATLVIEPGAIIKFHPADGPYMVLGGAGTIIAQGTASKPIVFTSYKDDAHGCDTNGDGSATQPARLDWGDIDLQYNPGSVFDYCEFYYGGDSTYSATLTFGARTTVTNSVFAHNDGSDSSGWYGALDASASLSTPGEIAGTVIANNVFYDNVRPLSVNSGFDVDDSNTFHNPAAPWQTNTYNGIFVETINDVTSHRTWRETEVAFVIDDNDWWIVSGASLTLGDNVVLKFRPGSELVLDNGSSALVNYGGAGVYFTSYKDDSLKGDTNGDGGATSPGYADWVGIFDNSLTLPSPYYFTWSNIRYDAY